VCQHVSDISLGFEAKQPLKSIGAVNVRFFIMSEDWLSRESSNQKSGS
jgi:hypothetical protein